MCNCYRSIYYVCVCVRPVYDTCVYLNENGCSMNLITEFVRYECLWTHASKNNVLCVINSRTASSKCDDVMSSWHDIMASLIRDTTDHINYTAPGSRLLTRNSNNNVTNKSHIFLRHGEGFCCHYHSRPRFEGREPDSRVGGLFESGRVGR